MGLHAAWGVSVLGHISPPPGWIGIGPDTAACNLGRAAEWVVGWIIALGLGWLLLLGRLGGKEG